MKTFRKIFILLCVATFVSCDNNDTKVLTETEHVAQDGFEPAFTIPVWGMRGQTDTRALYIFNSDNLTVARSYETGDKMFVFNHFLQDAAYVYYTYARLGMMNYLVASNNFKTDLVTFATSWDATTHKFGAGRIADADSMMFALFDSNCTDLRCYPSKDTSIVLGLNNQKGTQVDCFSRQLPFCRVPKVKASGTHMWINTTAFYWLIFKFPDKDVQKITNIKIHADEPLVSRAAWKYRGYLSKTATEYNSPNATGTNSWNSDNSGADAFISFWVGDGTATFNNFGFDITYILTDGSQHTGSVDVRPQVKVAAAGNLYKNAFMISGAHGVQNMYIDEIVEVDKWDNAYNGTGIAPKSGADSDEGEDFTGD